MSQEQQDRFEAFAREHGPFLSRLVFLLMPQPGAAADLFQVALEWTYAAWPRVERADDSVACTRRILANAAADEARAGRRRPARTDGNIDAVGAGDRTREVEDRADLITLLAGLPARQRTVVVLRYYADLSEAQTAALLGISTGPGE